MIELVNATSNLLKALIEGDEATQRALGVAVPENWSTFGAGAFQYALDRITEVPESVGWWTHLAILNDPPTLVGSCGYKGPPNSTGMVEIGYEVAPTFRNRGIATEITRLLVHQAFANPAVSSITAHTLGEENASVKVLRKAGFAFSKALEFKEEGTVWRWELLRASENGP